MVHWGIRGRWPAHGRKIVGDYVLGSFVYKVQNHLFVMKSRKLPVLLLALWQYTGSKHFNRRRMSMKSRRVATTVGTPRVSACTRAAVARKPLSATALRAATVHAPLVLPAQKLALQICDGRHVYLRPAVLIRGEALRLQRRALPAFK